MSNRSQQQTTWWPTAKAYALHMGLPYPIKMRDEEHDKRSTIDTELVNLHQAFKNIRAIKAAHAKYFPDHHE